MPTAGTLSELASFPDSRLRILNAENSLLIVMESLDQVLAHYADKLAWTAYVPGSNLGTIQAFRSNERRKKEVIGRGLPFMLRGKDTKQRRLDAARVSANERNGLNMSTKAAAPSFTVMHDEGALALVHQLRVRPPIRNLELVGTVVRCMGAWVQRMKHPSPS